MLILGHRGAIHGTLSQNSLGAFREALEIADGFETDACLSKDGDVFLIHETNTSLGIREYLDTASAERTGTRCLRHMTAAEIASLRLKDGQSIPTLREALQLAGEQVGKVINIELKSYGVAAPVIKLLGESFRSNIIKPQAIIISSFHHAALVEVRRVMPDLPIGALVVYDNENGEPLYPFDDEAGARGATYAGLTQALQSPLLKNEVRPNYFVMPEKLLFPETAKRVSATYEHAQLCGWTVTEDADYDQDGLLQRLEALRSGKDKIAAMIVDNPRRFVMALRNEPS